MEIAELRKQMDEADGELVSAFVKRMRIAAQIADYKKEKGLPVLDAEREREKLEAVAALAPDTLCGETRTLYRALFEISRSYQNRLLSGKPGNAEENKRDEAFPVCGEKRFTLIGSRLGHSYSPELHGYLSALLAPRGLSYRYSLTELTEGEIGSFLKTTTLDGFNVTFPYKKTVIPYLCGISPTAKRLGSVNTVVRTEKGFFGYNTDYAGFSYLLRSAMRRYGISVGGKKAVVLGNGGVCPTVCAVLHDFGVGNVTVISRSGENNYGNLYRNADADILVNTTPVGMYPDAGHAPVSLDAFPRVSLVLDLIYNPFETALMADARKRGIPNAGGIAMLAAQGKRAAELFTGTTLPDSVTEDVLSALILSKRNLVLIGMPGSGKSTVGYQLSKRLHRTFVDADKEIVRLAGKPTAKIIEEDGEDAFRRLEHTVLETLGAKSGIVLATGGGCVTRKENYAPLAQNGVILCIDRPVDMLSTRGRPLSRKKTPEALYAERRELYQSFADVLIQNTGTRKDGLCAAETAFCSFPYTIRT